MRKIQMFKVVPGVLTVVVLAISVMGFKCTRRVTGTVSCPAGQRCTTTVSGQIEWRNGETLQTESDAISNRVFILDLAQPWQPDSSFTPQAIVNVDSSAGRDSQNFTLVYSPTISQSLGSVDADTVPRAFVFDDPTAVKSFLDTSASRSSSAQPEVTTDTTLAVTQTNCTAPSAKYINHVRYQENGSSRIGYVDTVYFDYTASSSSSAGCNQGQINILE